MIVVRHDDVSNVAVDRSERLHTLRQIHRRLKPGASIVIAGHSAPGPDPERWMTRSVAFGDRAGLDWAKARSTGKMMAERLPLLAPAEEEDLLRQAGFLDVALFYAAFPFAVGSGSLAHHEMPGG